MGCASSIEEDEWLLGLAATKYLDLSLSPLLDDTSAMSPATATAIRDARPTILLTPTWPRPYAPLSGAGFKALCCAASKTIRTVSVTEAAVPKVSPAAIVEALASLPSLTHLTLAGATIPRRVAIRLAAKKGSMAALVTAVTLAGPCVDCGTVAALQVSAPHLETLRLVDVFPSFDWLTVIAALKFPALTAVIVNGSVLTNGVQTRVEDSPLVTHQRAQNSNEVEVAPGQPAEPAVHQLSCFSARLAMNDETEEHPLPTMPHGPTISDQSMNLASTLSGATSRVLLRRAHDHDDTSAPQTPPRVPQPPPPACSQPRPHVSCHSKPPITTSLSREVQVVQKPRHILVPQNNTNANITAHNDSPRRTGARHSQSQPQAFSQSVSQSPCQSQCRDLMSCSRNPLSLPRFAASSEFSAEATRREDDGAPVAPASVGVELASSRAGAHTTNGAGRVVREVSMGGEKKRSLSLAPEDITVDAKCDGFAGGASAAQELVAVSHTATPQLSTTMQQSSAAGVGLAKHFFPEPSAPPVASDKTTPVPFPETTIAPCTTDRRSPRTLLQSSFAQLRLRTMHSLEFTQCTVADDRCPATPDHVREWIDAQCAPRTSTTTLPPC